MYGILQRHRVVLPVIARLSCFLLFVMHYITCNVKHVHGYVSKVVMNILQDNAIIQLC